MIRLTRVSEPPELVDIRGRELRRIRGLGVVAPSSDQVGDAYRAFASDLRSQQHFKCCYCEKPVEEGFNDVEHYRPKARADRHPGSTENHGYWWLAWTWDNLLFACPNCNRSGKNDRFPLDHGSASLQAEAEPPGREQPLLIDPFAEDPLDHIVFVKVQAGWVPIGRSPKGEETIRIIKLDRDDLIDFYNHHAEALAEDMEEVANASSATEREVAFKRLKRRLRKHFQFLALTYDLIDDRFDKSYREQHGLELPRPPL
jgi:uncharacterized protein (TIGR02646 family)